jgi:hypothetical protein
MQCAPIIGVRFVCPSSVCDLPVIQEPHGNRENRGSLPLCRLSRQSTPGWSATRNLPLKNKSSGRRKEYSVQVDDTLRLLASESGTSIVQPSAARQ